MRTPSEPETLTGAPVVLDLRDRPAQDRRDGLLEDLRQAYEERWRLFTEAAPEESLLQNALELRELEFRCRPAPRVLPRRTGPDPATFLG